MRLNAVDKAVAYFNPSKGLERLSSRKLLASYEALTPKNGKRPAQEKKSAAELARVSQLPIAQQARWFEENYPLVTASLDEVAKNAIGPEGLTAQPLVKLKNGKPATAINDAIKRLYDQSATNWCMDGRTHRAESEILITRSVVRDGEIFSRVYEHGGHDYLGAVPFGIEPFECDHIDAGLNDKKQHVVNGFKLGKYNRTEGYYFTPDPTAFSIKPVLIPENEISHVAWKVRVSALRGISKLAPAILAIHNLKEYEDAVKIERLVAARLTMVHKKDKSKHVENQSGEPEDFDEPLSFEFANIVEAGIKDEFVMLESAKGAGESNSYIQHQQRNITSAIGVNNSSVTGIYNKSFSAQRQELIDRWATYIMLRALVVRDHVRPMYERWLNAAWLAGLLPFNANDIDWDTLYDVQFIGPVMPWIDPYKEANALQILMKMGMLPLTKALAERGLNVSNVLQMYHEERVDMKKLGLMDFLAAVADHNTNPTDKDDGKTKKE